MKIGLQTFTIRHAQKKSITNAYLPLIELGIKSFEVARIDFSDKNANELRQLVDEHGIEISSIQVKPKYVFGASERIISFCHTVGCKRVVISMLPFSCILGKEKRFYDFIATLDKQYELYAKHGITLAYHHHNWEYVPLSSGKTRMEEFLAKTEKIRFVNDTYWTAKCAVDPADQIRLFGERLIGIHLRDLCFYKHGLDVPSKDCPVGDGVISFKRVLSAAKASGCEYLVIEQNSKEPYRDIEKSYRHLASIK